MVVTSCQVCAVTCQVQTCRLQSETCLTLVIRCTLQCTCVSWMRCLLLGWVGLCPHTIPLLAVLSITVANMLHGAVLALRLVATPF